MPFFSSDANVHIGGQGGRTFIGLVAGTIIDAVAALFFVQSNKARQLMVDFFDRLRNDRKLDESLQLVSRITDEDLKSRIHALLALNFAEIKPTDVFLNSLFGLVKNGELTLPTDPGKPIQTPIPNPKPSAEADPITKEL